MTGGRLDGDTFEAQRLDRRVLVVTGGTHGLGAAIAARAARSVIDFDQTVHGPLGEHVAPAQAGAAT